MHNPLRSEAEAFRWVVVIGAACAAVIALALLTEPRYGAILGALLLGRYAPYADSVTTPPRGPIRRGVRRGVLTLQSRRR